VDVTLGLGAVLALEEGGQARVIAPAILRTLQREGSGWRIGPGASVHVTADAGTLEVEHLWCNGHVFAEATAITLPSRALFGSRCGFLATGQSSLGLPGPGPYGLAQGATLNLTDGTLSLLGGPLSVGSGATLQARAALVAADTRVSVLGVASFVVRDMTLMGQLQLGEDSEVEVRAGEPKCSSVAVGP
jgi:hypothetical protein